VILEPGTAKILEFNDRACQQLGYSREEFALLRVPDIEVKETAKETNARIRKVVSQGCDDFKTLQRTKLGEIRVSLARMQVNPENERLDLLREAETASIRAQTLTKQLLTFAKGVIPVKETASIKDIIKECSL